MRALIFVAIALSGVAHAQPSDADLTRATELYNAATQAMTEGRYADAARDFTAAYEITKDPVLFFKIGSAHDKAGACDVAIGFYRRYLDEAKPEPRFVTLTEERIQACAPIVEKPAEPAAPAAPAPAAEAPPDVPAPAPAAAASTPSRDQDAAWLLVGGALTFVTVGAVLAYSAESAEQDIKDLYVSNNGRPPAFDDETRARYDDLLAEGRRYEVLAWSSFGVATGCAIGAAIFFMRSSREEPRVSVTPVLTPRQTGLAATLRF